MAAKACGVLSDRLGLECLRCHGACTITSGEEPNAKTINCPDCDGEGQTPASPEELAALPRAELLDLEEIVMLCVVVRERGFTAKEWLEQPAAFCAAYEFLARWLSEFEERKGKLTSGGEA